METSKVRVVVCNEPPQMTTRTVDHKLQNKIQVEAFFRVASGMEIVRRGVLPQRLL